MNLRFSTLHHLCVPGKNRRGGLNRIIVAAAGAIIAGVILPASLLGQVNSWTGSTDGNWQDPNWSLGVLPGPGQTILMTNAGSKTVTISAATAAGFPQSLAVDSVTISSPPSFSNTLLLNSAGVNNPLIAGSLALGSNSAVVVSGSGLLVSNAITVAGTFTENPGSVVTNLSLDVESAGSGGYILNSGLLASGFGAGEDVGASVPSTFTQNGGTNDSFAVRIYTNSIYRLNGGFFDGAIIARPNAIFQQQGGVVDNSTNADSIASFDGTFLQSGGIFIGPTNGAMYFPGYIFVHQGTASGAGLQTGGTNEEGNLMIGLQLAPENQDNGNVPTYGGAYTLSNGVLSTAGTSIGGNGTMEQAGGTHTVDGPLSLQGALYYSNNLVSSDNSSAYTLDGGSLSSTALSIGVASRFVQQGGTNQVLGDITLTRSTNPIGYFIHGRYSLIDGLLSALNVFISGGGLVQTAGEMDISNNLQIADGIFQQSGGQVTQSGLLTLANASWSVAPGVQRMGELLLGVSSSSASLLTMPSAACALTLRDSSGITWSNSATLNIAKWAGSIYGGGNQRIVFGSTTAALTAQQLGQISFQNPAGLAAGSYPARILATGEIVPGTGSNLPPSFTVARSNSTIQIALGGQIGTSYAIQISTDLVHWVNWTTQSNSSGTISVSDSITTGPVRFYRAVALP